MKEYFQLQFKMANRHILAFGLPVLLGYILLLVGFVGFSFYLFYKVDYAAYIYLLLGLSFILKFGEVRRNDLLKICFPSSNYKKIRLLENGIGILPFVLFLLFKMEFVAIGILLVAAFLLALIPYTIAVSKTIPTPFFKRPFEFVIGFRKTFYLFGLAYFLTIMAIWVDNFNLGVFGFLLVFLVVMAFYSEVEDEYYVWVHSMNPQAFLWYKIKISLRYTTWLSVPILIGLGVFYSEHIPILLGLLLLGFLYVSVIILGKYGAYPSQISIPDGFLIVMSLFFPPLLLVAIPFFWRKSVRRLNNYLA